MAKQKGPRQRDRDDPRLALFAQPGLSLRALEIFVAVAKAGTMVAAAKDLKLTQPAVSQAIAGLEAALGVELFDRSLRPPAMTLVAAALIADATDITDAARRIQNKVRLQTATPIPHLRVGMLNSFATSIGPHVLGQLRDIVDGWSIDSGFTASRFENLVNRDFDFLITADLSRVPDDVDVTPILTEPYVAIAPADYASRKPSLKALGADLDLIRFGRDPTLQSRTDEVLREKGVFPAHRYHLDTTEAVLTMIAAGGGWGILTPLAVYRSIARGDRIKAWPLFDRRFGRTINIASLRGAGRDIHERIRRASITALKEHVLPAVRAAMPDCAKLITIPD